MCEGEHSWAHDQVQTASGSDWTLLFVQRVDKLLWRWAEPLSDSSLRGLNSAEESEEFWLHWTLLGLQNSEGDTQGSVRIQKRKKEKI